MKTKVILNNAKSKLVESGIDSIRDAEFLLAHVLNCKVFELVLISDITATQEQIYSELILRRCAHEPMDSLLGYTEFLGVNIPFHKETLSPRQETEIMVDTIITENSSRGVLDVLDMCTGSGCIGLAIAKHLQARVTLADISDDALDIALENAKLNDIQVSISKSNLFDNISGTFDIIISNPPYIPSNECGILEKEVTEYDPLLALDGGVDGLDFYRKIISNAPKFLREGGLIYLEMGIGQSVAIKSMLSSDFENIKIYKDYAGIDRFVRAKLK